MENVKAPGHITPEEEEEEEEDESAELNSAGWHVLWSLVSQQHHCQVIQAQPQTWTHSHEEFQVASVRRDHEPLQQPQQSTTKPKGMLSCNIFMFAFGNLTKTFL